jgi:solute carrier family 25 uncoupling protein 8/9
MSPPPSGPQLALLPSFACSAVAACIAEATTIPLDTAKVRLQMQGGLLKAGEAPKYRRARVGPGQLRRRAPRAAAAR